MARTPSFRPAARLPALLAVSATILGLFGLALGAAGAWLVALGGSWYYLLAGLGLIAAAVLLPRGGGRGLWAYALVVVFTLAWALWEVGLDWWPMAARGDRLEPAPYDRPRLMRISWFRREE